MSTFVPASFNPYGKLFFTYMAVYDRKIPLGKPEKIYNTAEAQRAQRDEEGQRKGERRTSNEKKKIIKSYPLSPQGRGV